MSSLTIHPARSKARCNGERQQGGQMQVQEDIGVRLVFTAWSLAEVVRYPWYLASLLQTPSARLTWLR